MNGEILILSIAQVSVKNAIIYIKVVN